MPVPVTQPLPRHTVARWDLQGLILDRDGTVNVAPTTNRYLLEPGELELLPGVAEAIARVNDVGRPVIIVTNQQCVGLGLLSADGLARIHERLADLLSASGAHVDAIYVCPHLATAGCRCRKPRPGLVQDAVTDFALDRTRVAMVGDAQTDIEAAEVAGVVPILVGGDVGSGTGTAASAWYPDVLRAVQALLDR